MQYEFASDNLHYQDEKIKILDVWKLTEYFNSGIKI